MERKLIGIHLDSTNDFDRTNDFGDANETKWN